MKSYISREDAIDAICKNCYMCEGICTDYENLMALPPADVQPEPCEDAVSRKAVIEITAETGALETQYRVKRLPPVTPKQRTGEWIEDKGQQILMQNFIERGEVWRVCSVCGAGHMIGHKYASDKAYHNTYHNFCPNCGAKMDGKE